MIILRQEKFGGIAFNPNNAHELWLDSELFNLMARKKQRADNKIHSKASEVFRKLAVKDRSYKVILPKQTSINEIFPFQVLNSPVLADINITNKCNLNCPHCYVSSNRNGKEMSRQDLQLVLNECEKAGVLQIAVGGGEPTLHPLFTDFLKEIRKRNIVPNVTSNGKILNWKTVYAMARYAGAVALSIEETDDRFEQRRKFPFKDFLKSVKKLKAAGVKLVFQIVISKGNLDRVNQTVREMVKYNPYGILFLAYKPQGRGKKYDLPLSKANQLKVNKVLGNIFNDLKGKTKIGFDCCLTPALIGIKNSSSFIGCSASRTSIAIMPDLTVLPCSFLNQDSNKWDNLRHKNLLDIWQSDNFNNFRRQIARKLTQPICKQCPEKNICLGGCPIFPLVNCKYNVLFKESC
ncbi:MAG: radical SAM protein [Patescibacteria group bacterium]|nr:radical SAM protein [Patescibacteria group bacterium]